MSAPRERRLVSLRRRVTPERIGDYAALWEVLAGAVNADGSHAWRFVSRNDPSVHLEFLEFSSAADPRSRPEVAAALARIDAVVSPASVEEWLQPR